MRRPAASELVYDNKRKKKKNNMVNSLTAVRDTASKVNTSCLCNNTLLARKHAQVSIFSAAVLNHMRLGDTGGTCQIHTGILCPIKQGFPLSYTLNAFA